MINVTCALIRNDDEHVLVVQRGSATDHPFKWEFPGGKVRDFESAEECISREIMEELSLDIILVDELTPVEHDYGHKKVRLIPFVCDTLANQPVLHEHKDYKWLAAGRLATVDFSEADIPVAMEYIRKYGEGHMPAEDPEPDAAVDSAGIKEMLAGKTGFGAIDLLAELAVENTGIRHLLMKYSLGTDSTLAFRASYTLTRVEESKPGVLKPLYGQMISSLSTLANESVARSFLKIINLSGTENINERDHGILAENCFSLLNKGRSAIAIKAYCMEAIYNLTLIYPELASELAASITRNMEEGSAGIIARGRHILKKLSNIS